MPGARRLAVLAAVALVVLAAIAAVGRWERGRWIDEQQRGMRRIQALVGPLDQRLLYGYRVLPQFDCLVYRRDGNPLALELCIDSSGRLVEAIDRRGVRRHYYTLRAMPSASSIRVSRDEVDRLLRRMEAGSG